MCLQVITPDLIKYKKGTNKNEMAKSNKIQHLLLVGVKTSTRKNTTQLFLCQ